MQLKLLNALALRHPVMTNDRRPTLDILSDDDDDTAIMTPCLDFYRNDYEIEVTLHPTIMRDTR